MINDIEKNLDFELIIKNKNNRFKATSPLFPQCKGLGDTKSIAINSLCKSIGNFIGRKTSIYLQNNLTTPDYAEIITDINQKKSFEHRIINLDINKSFPTKRVYINQMSFPASLTSKNQSDMNFPPINEHLSLNKDLPKSDDSILGITVCLN